MSQCYFETVEYLAFNTNLIQTGLIKGLSVSLVRGRISKDPASVSVARLSFRSFFPSPQELQVPALLDSSTPLWDYKDSMLCHSNPFYLQFFISLSLPYPLPPSDLFAFPPSPLFS